MKKILLLCAAIAIVSVIVIACKKEASSAKIDNAFDARAVKEWYYATFKRSPEWASSSLKGKKLPDWKHPVAGKIGNNEAIEFPLVEKTTSFAVPVMAGNKVLTAAERTRIAEASLSKIVFIKKADGNILVREVDYIPGWEYLQDKKFDISSVSLVSPGNNFSGLVVVKHWDGTAVSRSIFENGKFTRKGELEKNKESRSNLTEDMECHDVEFCIWQQDCDMDIDGDQVTITCGEWYNTGSCWTEQYCQYVGSPCEMYGIGCDEGSGGDEGENCNDKEQELQGISTSESLFSETTSETATTRTKKYHWVIFKQNQNLWQVSSHEAGVHVKTNSLTNPWKWQSLEHTSVSKEGGWVGGVVDCTVNTTDINVGLYWASIELDYNISASAICKGFPIGFSGKFSSAKIIGINE